MNGAFYVAGIGLSSQQAALDVLANNIANLNTQGYKRLDLQFSEMVNLALADSADGVSSSSVDGLSGVTTQTRLSLNEQGDLERTDQPLDLSLDGPGFIELLGRDGQSYLWRGGHLDINEDGYLAGPGGLMLAAQIRVPDEAVSLLIGSDGKVLVTYEGGDSEELGEIGLLRLMNEEALQRVDSGLYSLHDATAAEHADAGQGGMGFFVQGSLERSNVDLNAEMIEMMIVQRAYSANAQIVQAADQLASIANNLRR